jgi:adenine deaminase
MASFDLATGIAQGRGAEPADLVLKGGRVFDLITGALFETDVAVSADRIVGTHGTYRGVREIDVDGLVLVPGFIDTTCTSNPPSSRPSSSTAASRRAG